MLNIYLFFIIILFFLAFSDLFVGVANDAVNFLNSAIGARAASFKVVMVVASVGLVVGATFSSGLMEVARKGLFFPGQFTFSDVMVIFVAVMVADVILLDIYNTFGLPTSTTVSIVFDLLGAAVGVAIIKLAESDQSSQELGQYINSGRALAIITGILVSVVLAFVFGSLIQYLTRLIFTFNIRHNLKYFAAVWGAAAITGILYFIVIKGAKGASFVTLLHVDYIEQHTGTILLYSFLSLAVLLQVLISLFKLNVLKLIVLTGTFALALAFAGNDMVNFIGVPLAGLYAFQLFSAVPGADPDTFMMGGLADDVVTETWILIIAGLFMVLTIWTSKKARTVIETSVDLSRQQEGNERFNSSILSRNIVRGAIRFSSAISQFLPAKMVNWLEKRFDEPDEITKKATPEGAAFDLLRASVNLVVASVLIAFGTSLKLPLSTTYVTFMVAMGTSLSDRAWGRESAVYRITGVLSVIGGWFFTALAAFTLALLASVVIYYGGLIALILLLSLAIYLFYRTHLIHTRRAEDRKADLAMDTLPEELTPVKIMSKSSKNMQEVLETILSILNDTITGLVDEDRKTLKNAKTEVNKLNNTTKRWKSHMSTVLMNLKEDPAETGQYYVQSVDYLREITHCISYIAGPSYEHIENNHKSLISSQIEEISHIQGEIRIFIEEITGMIRKNNFEDFDLIIARQQTIMRLLDESRKRQIRRIKNNETGTRNSVLYLNILAELKNLSLYCVNLLKTERDFVAASKVK
ncbi:MAG TPA: inorganic phosphate transporter [Lentimicrobium sp.]|nr:inorganic phosphate transporter [Lentimicrobium sp.]